jgi:ribosomal protein S18 acetylase RimI-like enzyme
LDSEELQQNQGSIVVRPGSASDLERHAIFIDGHPMFACYGLTPETLLASFQRSGESSRVLVAEVDGTPAGFVWLISHGAFARSGYIRLLVVAQEFTGAGVGDQLMDAAEAALLGEGDDVLLLVNAGNARARRFYERRGYHQVGELVDYVVFGQSECIYRKRSAR